MENSISRADFEAIPWLLPWEPSDVPLEDQLQREVGRVHPLYGRKAITIGRRVDNDDVLFFLPDGPAPLAVVHLTWSGRREERAEWPSTILYASLQDWVERCMKADHLEYTLEA
jgi:hypothetical protein